ncbi:hypothetical protein ABZ135_20175 [Streptomyces sp. NPDC006339]|uniref:hypothetical protein n=1 Tax=Streptomyces sp. NPDC006339 TaxID=3156755 RepID=UPI0033B6BC8B
MSRRNSVRAAGALAAGLLSIAGLAGTAVAQTSAPTAAVSAATGSTSATSSATNGASAAAYNLVYHRTFHGYTRDIAWYQCNNAGQNGVRNKYWFVYECRSAGEITYDLYVAWTGSP